MSVYLEYINFIVPIDTIEKKYPGGWRQCRRDYSMAISRQGAWYDENLFRLGAMNPGDIERCAREWEEMGFRLTGNDGRGKFWKDCCVVGSTLPCDWLTVDSKKFLAHLKGHDSGILFGPPECPPARMVGAMIGNIAGSGYARENIKEKPRRLIRRRDRFTSDTVLTYAVAEGILRALKNTHRAKWLANADMRSVLESEIVASMRKFAENYPRAGYGKKFLTWLKEGSSAPYNSLGNGSAMRVSFAGWYAESLEEAKLLAEISARVTHNHPEGIKGAVAVAGCIYLLKEGRSKKEVREYAEEFYDLGFTLDAIRPEYKFDVTCEGSVPQAIVAFLENESFGDVLRAAISIGGDSDTIAAIAGSLAEVIYPVKRYLLVKALRKLDDNLKSSVRRVHEALLDVKLKKDPDLDEIYGPSDEIDSSRSDFKKIFADKDQPFIE
jgi:ADP-ribosylglycohydrolase